MTSLAGRAKAKKADEPVKKVVLKKDDITIIVIHSHGTILTW
jgi:hypothetical protein